MKKILLLTSLIFLTGNIISAKTDKHYLDSLTIKNKSIERVGDKVVVKMDIDMSRLDMNTQHSMRVVPFIVSVDGVAEDSLKSIIINGRTRNKVMDRMEGLGNLPAEDTLERYNSRNKKMMTIHYEDEIPFRRWMINGSMDLRGYVTGCASCNKWNEMLSTGNVLEYNEPAFAMSAKMTPQEEIIKRRADNVTARLQFQQDKYDIIPEFSGNTDELRRIQESFNSTKNDMNLTITGIYIEGYASPEGTVAHNIELSKRRALSLTDYIKKNNKDLDDTLWHVSWKGEDWDGFLKALKENKDLAYREEILEVLENCDGNQDKCEQQILSKVGEKAYYNMMYHIYIPLRRNEYRIEYNVCSLGIDEVKALLHVRPKQLSVAEIQRAADTYEINSEEYKDALHIAVETYPDNIAARNNAALSEIETGNFEEAIRLLKDTEEPSLLNMLGVAYFKNGMLEQARDSFARAAGKGYTDAEENLRKLDAVMPLLK